MVMWKYELSGTRINTRGPIQPALVAHVWATYAASDPNALAEPLGASVRASIAEFRCEWPQFFLTAAPYLMAPVGGGTVDLRVELPVDRDVLRIIETARARSGRGDMTLKLEVGVRYRLVTRDNGEVAQQLLYRSTQTFDDRMQPVEVTISRDQWLQMLSQLQQDDVEVIELPRSVTKDSEEFAEYLRELREASGAYSRGEYQTAVVSSRKAVEAVLGADMKAGAEQLTKMLFPLDEDAPRRDLVDMLLRALGPLRNASAHGKDPRFRVTRADAEFCVVLACQLYRYMNHAIAAQRK